MPNPFLLTHSQVGQPPQPSGDLNYGGVVVGGGNGGGGGQVLSKPGPPQRPPPPQASGGAAGATASPAHTIAEASAAAPKSAFDDLNDSIRMALGGSPAKQPPMAASGGGGVPPMLPVTNMMQPQMAGYSTSPQPQQSMYSSPAKQPALGPCLYSFLSIFPKKNSFVLLRYILVSSTFHVD